ncbi:MAG TPA: hypothetical protein VIC08_15685 [Cellvibrionaceae bacterium]
MKKISVMAGLLSGLMASGAYAHDKVFIPESHAPAGVMSDHMHKSEEIMTGYRYLRSSYQGLYHGSEEVGLNDLAEAGFSMAATGMTMEMIMLDVMYAPTDWLTLMVMPMYMRMDMDMVATGAADHGHGDMGHDHHDNHGHAHGHSISGFGDTNISAMLRLAGTDNHQFIGTFGLSVPTGKVDKKNPDDTFVHYGMQLGSGTWDLTPSLTYTGFFNRLSLGAQAGAVIRLEDENDSGFAFGDKYYATAWGALRVTDWMSLSARIGWEEQDPIAGHYNGPHNHSAPEDFQENYGGTFTDAGIGANFVVTGGNFAGVRLGVEWMTRLEQDYHGYQLGLDDGLNLSISYAFK